MFQLTGFQQLQFLDHGQIVGKVYYNGNFPFAKEKARPFVRNQKMVIKSDGRVNYALLDQFVVSSLTDFYQKISTIKDAEERTKQINEYQKLYYLWQKVMQARQSGDINLNSYYDDVVYQLYLRGYRN